MSESFVPEAFVVPAPLVTPAFRLDPLGPRHNEEDRAELDGPLHQAIPQWLASSWPWRRPDYADR